MSSMGIVGKDGKKHFKGNTMIGTDTDGNRWLMSWGTKVCYIKNGELVRTWGGWSASTGHHVKAFCELNGLKAPNKAQWIEMSVER